MWVLVAVLLMSKILKFPNTEVSSSRAFLTALSVYFLFRMNHDATAAKSCCLNTVIVYW
jgi:hypothetical protein